MVKKKLNDSHYLKEDYLRFIDISYIKYLNFLLY